MMIGVAYDQRNQGPGLLFKNDADASPNPGAWFIFLKPVLNTWHKQFPWMNLFVV